MANITINLISGCKNPCKCYTDNVYVYVCIYGTSHIELFQKSDFWTE